MASQGFRSPGDSPSSDADNFEAIMRKGSKTFSLAARLFDRRRRQGAELLYAWCRYCDDAIDSAPDQEHALSALMHVRHQTQLALQTGFQVSTGAVSAFADSTGAVSEFTDSNVETLNRTRCEPAFEALAFICRTYQIPALYPTELINGMEMDTVGIRIQDESALDLYCYRVASVVGLMMSHIMGVKDPQALRHAVDTGLAMQMTNIARDVRDDFLMKRIYIPDAWFIEAGRARPAVEAGAEFDARDFTEVTRHLIFRADLHYRSGRAGLKYLPWRAAFAVSAAQRVYREIGVRVVRRGQSAWISRTYVGFGRKLFLMSVAIADVVFIKLTASLRDLFKIQNTKISPGAKTVGSTGDLQLGGRLFGPGDL